METITHGEKIELNEFKGTLVETGVCCYRVSGYEPFYKELTATIVFSARNLQPHVILSVTCNGVTQYFGTDTKKAIDYYNSL